MFSTGVKIEHRELAYSCYFFFSFLFFFFFFFFFFF